MNTLDLVDIHEGRRITGLESQTLYRLGRQGRVRVFRVLKRAVRFHRPDLEALVQQSPLPITSSDSDAG